MYDTMLRCEGDVVRQMQASFFLNFVYNGGTVDTGDFPKFLNTYLPVDSPGQVKAYLRMNVPRQQHSVTESYFCQMEQARNYLYVINPYFSDNRVVDRLMEAARRG